MNGGPIRVLYVDGDSGAAEPVGALLEREADRLQVETTAGTEAARRRLDERGFDCVVSTYEMPHGDGVSFLESVRADYLDLPFVLHTDAESEAVVREAVSADVTDYLRKGTGTAQYALLATQVTNAVRRRRAERTAERSQRRLDEFTAHTTDVLWAVSAGWDELLFVSGAYETDLGQSRAALRDDPDTLLRYCRPDGRTVEELKEALADGESVDVECRVDGATEIDWVRMQGEPITDADGRVARIVGSLRDVTDRKEREQRQRLFREAVEAAGHSVYFTDRSGEIQYANPAFEETTGFDSEAVTELNPRILKSGAHDREYYEELWDTILSGEVWRNEITNKKATGERYVADQTIAPVEDDAGEITHFVAVNADITEKHEYEKRLERQNERLEQFAQIVSHDLRNPLNTAKGYLGLLAEDAADDEAHIETIHRALARMDEIISEMLVLVRDGKSADTDDTVDVRETARTAWMMAGDESATLTVRNGVEKVAGNEAQLQQLFENLFRNAVKHGGDGVAVEVGAIADAGFYVADDGPGIPAEKRDRIFDAGYTDSQTGTGIGLASVREICDAHGWEIAVTESAAGGARFEVTNAEFEGASGSRDA